MTHIYFNGCGKHRSHESAFGWNLTRHIPETDTRGSSTGRIFSALWVALFGVAFRFSWVEE